MLHFRYQDFSTALAAAICLSMVFSSGKDTDACDFCVNLGDVLTPSHPRSIELALATQKAVESGRLKHRTLVSPKVLDPGQRRMMLENHPARLIVRQWAKELTPRSDQPCRLHILFVDTRETCELVLRGQLVIYSDDATGPSDARLVTTRPVIHGIASGRLTLASAIQTDLAVVESEQSSSNSEAFFLAKQ